MHSTTVIRKPMITEKSTIGSSEYNRYSFEVDRRASKPQIKRAVEDLYSVRVLGVATQNRKGRMRRNRFGFWRSDRQKIAVVKVHPEDKIEMF